jgi:hypothetical protein
MPFKAGSDNSLSGPQIGPNLPGLAACLALLELEARALERPLAACLIAAAAEALRDPPSRRPNGAAGG